MRSGAERVQELSQSLRHEREDHVRLDSARLVSIENGGEDLDESLLCLPAEGCDDKNEEEAFMLTFNGLAFVSSCSMVLCSGWGIGSGTSGPLIILPAWCSHSILVMRAVCIYTRTVWLIIHGPQMLHIFS